MNHTPGPWKYIGANRGKDSDPNEAGWFVQIAPRRYASVEGLTAEQAEANALLIAAAPTQHEEMLRFLPIIERAEADPELWSRLTAGTGIATANGYRAAIAKATQP